MGFFRQLFGFERPPSRGEAIVFRLYEVLIGGWMLRLVWEWGVYIQKIGDIVLPLGVAQYIDVSFMFDHGVSLLNAALISVCFILGFTRKWRHAYLAAIVLFHLQYVARNCLGEISHGSNLVGMSILAFGLSHATFVEHTAARRLSMGLIRFFVGLGYTSAAACKLVGTGPGWVAGHHLWMWIGERTVDGTSKFGHFELNALQELAMASWPVATALLVVGLVSEASAWMIWFRRTRPVAGLLLLGMHVGIWITMDILFLPNMLIIAAIAFPWPQVIDVGLRRRARRARS
jgi:hypothetical protein